MSKPNLLYYFPRKQNIYVTVLEDTLATGWSLSNTLIRTVIRWKNCGATLL